MLARRICNNSSSSLRTVSVREELYFLQLGCGCCFVLGCGDVKPCPRQHVTTRISRQLCKWFVNEVVTYFVEYIRVITNPLILTFDPNFQRDILPGSFHPFFPVEFLKGFRLIMVICNHCTSSHITIRPLFVWSISSSTSFSWCQEMRAAAAEAAKLAVS